MHGYTISYTRFKQVKQERQNLAIFNISAQKEKQVASIAPVATPSNNKKMLDQDAEEELKEENLDNNSI